MAAGYKWGLYTGGGFDFFDWLPNDYIFVIPAVLKDVRQRPCAERTI